MDNVYNMLHVIIGMLHFFPKQKKIQVSGVSYCTTCREKKQQENFQFQQLSSVQKRERIICNFRRQNKTTTRYYKIALEK